MLYEQIKFEYYRLEEQINSIRHELDKLPPGKLVCCHHQNHSKWYQSDGQHKSYIPKKNQSLAEELAQKKYLSYLLADLENEKRALSFYLKHHAKTNKSETLLTQSSEYQKLLSPYFSPLSQELAQWMQASCQHNVPHPENLVYKSASGNMVRSKSEMLIDMCLCIHNIPFRYEYPLLLDDATIYPDFTIRHPKTGRYYYWEHFGMMDNPLYLEHSLSKLQLYTSHQIIPGIHLITTYETKEHPLSTDFIEKIIDFYLS